MIKNEQTGGRTTARTRDAASAAKVPAKQDEENKAVTPASGRALPAHLAGKVKEDAGKGVSSDAADNMVPLIYILQGLSPQVEERDPAYIAGARPGDIWLRNAPVPIVKGDLGPLVQPCYFYKEVVEWTPRDDGGGYVARHDTMPADAEEVTDPKNPNRKKMVSSRGTEYVETRCHVVIVYLEDGTALPYVFPLSGSGHSASRQWMFMMNSKKHEGQVLPSYTFLYRLPTRQRQNKDGKWFMIEPVDAGTVEAPAYVSEAQYEAGRSLHEAFATGAKKAEAPMENGAGDEGGGAPNDAGGRI